MTTNNSLADLRAISSRIILSEAAANQFRSISVGPLRLGLAWNGHDNLQTINLPEYRLLLIGAGCSVAGIDTESGVVRFAVGLGFPFQFFLKSKYGFEIVSELTILSVSGEDCSIARHFVASDIIKDVSIKNGKLHITCLSTEFVV